jgi:chromosome segregation ATPase
MPIDDLLLRAGEVVILAFAVLYMARLYNSSASNNNTVLQRLLQFVDTNAEQLKTAQAQSEAAEKRAEAAEQRAAAATEALRDMKSVLESNTTSRNQHTEAINVQTKFIKSQTDTIDLMSKDLRNYTKLSSDDMALLRDEIAEFKQELRSGLQQVQENVLVRIDVMLEGCTTEAVLETVGAARADILSAIEQLKGGDHADRSAASGRDAGPAAVALPDAT